MHPQFALFDANDGIQRSPQWNRRIAIINCNPSSSGGNHYTIQAAPPYSYEVLLDRNPRGPTLSVMTIHVQWQGTSRPYQKLQCWDTGLLINGTIPIIDCDFNEVFLPRECNYTISGDTDALCSERQAFQKRLRNAAINQIISEYIPRGVLESYNVPLPPLPPLPPLRPVNNRPPTPLHISSRLYVRDDSDDSDDSDEESPRVPQPSAPVSHSASQIPLFVAELIKKEAIEKNTSCPISMESFSDCKALRLTSCYHLFESDALSTWLTTKDTCPLCKQQVMSTLAF